MKSKKFPRLGIVFLIAIFAIDLGVAMSESTEDSNQLTITQTVIREILSKVPFSIEKICVLEVSSDEYQAIKPLDLQYLDKRIVTDPSICGDQQSIDHPKIRIMYMNDVRIGIRQMERPSGQLGEIYDKVIEYLNAGNLVASAGLDRCGADINVYIFKIDEDGPQLIESAVIGTVKCLAK